MNLEFEINLTHSINNELFFKIKLNDQYVAALGYEKLKETALHTIFREIVKYSTSNNPYEVEQNVLNNSYINEYSNTIDLYYVDFNKLFIQDDFYFHVTDKFPYDHKLKKEDLKISLKDPVLEAHNAKEISNLNIPSIRWADDLLKAHDCLSYIYKGPGTEDLPFSMEGIRSNPNKAWLKITYGSHTILCINDNLYWQWDASTYSALFNHDKLLSDDEYKQLKHAKDLVAKYIDQTKIKSKELSLKIPDVELNDMFF